MKKLIYSLCFLLMAGINLSCDAWLSLEPEDGVTREDYWKTKEQVESGVVGIYCAMMDNECVKRFFLWGELRADMITGGSRPKAEYTSVISGEIDMQKSVTSWSSLYAVIRNCNLVIDYADQAVALDASYSQKEADLFKAEAKTLRGLMYFYLLRSFGEVPLVLEASISDDQNYHIAKSSKEEVMAQILTDLCEAEEVLFSNPSYNTEYSKGRITYWALEAILADVYLWNEDYEHCLICCDNLIKSKQFEMIPVSRTALAENDSVYYPNESDISNLFEQVYVTGNSNESIFELNFDENKTNGFYSLFSKAQNVLAPHPDNLDVLFPLYEGNDESVYDIRSNNFSYKSGMIWKYMGLNRESATRTTQQSYANWIFYRYPEILLFKAEALIQRAGADDLKEAYRLIREVRERANALDTEDNTFDPNTVSVSDLESLLLEERARELLFEGKRWYDVLRFAKRNNYRKISYLTDLALKSAPAGKQQSLQNKYGDYRSHYWPIYVDDIEANSALEQNAYYETTLKK